MSNFKFELQWRDEGTAARAGVVTTAHSSFETPAFIPVGSLGSIKGIPPWEVERTGSRILLANTYHLYLRPGTQVVAKLGGLHRMMGWNWSILTDSGGYQVFSLKGLTKVTEEGVVFQSHIDGSRHEISPEKAIGIQETLGSDIMMVLDECPEMNESRDRARKSMDLTTRWALRCLSARRKPSALFCIAQGGMYADLRREHAAILAAHPFDGMAIGGLSVGESKEVMWEMLSASLANMPEDKPRYLMGVGRPFEIVRAVGMGVDMFDCVLPTRSGRTGLLFTWNGEITLKQARYKFDEAPPDSICPCPVCARFSRAYLRHLFVAGDMLGPVLNTLHNLYFYQDLMREIRKAIKAGAYSEFARERGKRLDGSPD